jgi:hypothetical protein
VVEPADIRDRRVLELRVRSPHAIGDQLGLVRIHERLGQCVRLRLRLRLLALLGSELFA